MKAILKNDQGMVLVIAIMVMVILLSVTGAGLLFSGLNLKTTANLKSKGLAFYTTEAGLTHAWVELDNGDGVNNFATVFSSGATAVSPFSVTSFGAGSYTVTAQPIVGSNPNRIKLTSTGCLPAGCPSSSSKTVIEAEFKIEKKADTAIVANGDLTISGDPNIMGTCGGAHANEDMRISGSPGIQTVGGLTASNQTITSQGIEIPEGMEISGNPCIGSSACSLPPGQQPDANRLDTDEERDAYEAAHNSAPLQTIPKINPADYAQKVADLGAAGKGYICRLDGQIQQGGTCGSNGLCSGGTIVSPPTEWSCNNGDFVVNDDNAGDGVFYAEGKVVISGHPGSPSSPLQATLIARDDIKISGDPHIKPYPTTSTDLQNHLLVTGNDLEISGNVTANYAPAAILVHQQFHIGGDAKINGFIIAANGLPTWSGDPFPPSASPLGVTKNTISGHPTITYNCDFLCTGPACPKPVKMLTWRDIF